MISLLVQWAVYIRRFLWFLWQPPQRPASKVVAIGVSDAIVRELTAEEVAEAYQLCHELENMALTPTTVARDAAALERISKRLGEIVAAGLERGKRS